MVKERDMKGVQHYTSSPETKIMKDFLIGGIPGIYFHWPGGDVIMKDAPRLSNRKQENCLILIQDYDYS